MPHEKYGSLVMRHKELMSRLQIDQIRAEIG
jgi:hypothetical protein